MDVYLASPNNQIQADHANDMCVLLSFAICPDWIITGGYQETFRRILIDSGAFSEFSSGQKIDLHEYIDWSFQWNDHAEAIAGLDDISGDWRKSLSNYQKFENGFPTFHEADPIEFLDDCIDIAKDRNQWIGIGLLPPRGGKEKLVRKILDKIPPGIHVHGWAMRAYTHFRRFDSVDSTNWWRDAFRIKQISDLQHLTFGECLDIVIKRYKRWKRKIKEPSETEQKEMFAGE